jgi:hypothetical protein
MDGLPTFGHGSLRGLARLRDARRRRESSWDRTGGNKDFRPVGRGETLTLADIKGVGAITHIWMTISCSDPLHLRKLVLRMYWDGEENPSVETPVGDFFGLGHALYKNFATPLLAMSPQDGHGLNCFFPMPFANGARITVENQCDTDIGALYYYVDYEEYRRLEDGLGRFHAWWNRQRPTDGISEAGLSNFEYQIGMDLRSSPSGGLAFGDTRPDALNLTGEGNYVVLNAVGRGHFVGAHFDIENLRQTDVWNWYGEGDDMIFIDGELWPPSLHGTGTEDYYNCAWCPTQEYVAPYHGILLGGGPNWDRKISFYRYHIEDPVMFDTSCRVTIEHGHANRRNDDWSSTAYWYQTEPHLPFPPLRPASERLPTVKSWETEYQVPVSIVTFDGRIGTPAVLPPRGEDRNE